LRKYATAILVVSFFLAPPWHAWSATFFESGDFPCGTEPGGTLNTLFLRRQVRARQTRAALTGEGIRAPRPDLGNIAIVDDSEGVVLRPNQFDLHRRTVRWLPAGPAAAQYTAVSEPLQYDSAAADTGSPLAGLADDDTRLVTLPFSFPFYGGAYDAVYVNSDGNLTFGAPDTAISQRSLARAISGPPRIAPLFRDLDPSQPNAVVRYFAAADRAVVTWDQVPEYSTSGRAPRQTFQAALYSDGRIEFHYSEITTSEAVVGIAPGRLQGEAQAADLSAGLAAPASGAVAEIFTAVSEIDFAAVTQKFYRNHEDAYDFVVVFNNLGISPGGPGTFAFLQHLRNQVRGIGGLIQVEPVFDFGAEFGSPLRLQSLISMGPLSNYPADPNEVIPVFAGTSRNTAVTILGQESGHRFLAYPRYIDPATGQRSLGLLGRDNAHWSFFFNSDASVVEGNRIEDRGEGQSPRFRTAGTVERYGAFDQYLMGLRGAEEVPPSFLVRAPTIGFPSRQPQAGVDFDGVRQNVTAQMIIDAEGRRVPDHTVAQQHFNYAFVLVVREAAEPSAAEIQQLESLRLEWERFFVRATDNRGTASTVLARQLTLSTWPAGGLLRGSAGSATVSVAEPLASDLEVSLTFDSGLLNAPASVRIPAGLRSATFSVMGLREGVSELTARTADPAFEVSRTRVQVREDASQLRLEVVSGNGQRGARGASLGEPVVLRLRDQNEVPFSGVPVDFAASGDGVTVPSRAVSDADGTVRVDWRLASSGTLNTLRGSLAPAASVTALLTATALEAPVFTAAGVVNAASFNAGGAGGAGISPGSLVSIFGAGLAPEAGTAAFLPLPVTLGSVTVTVGGRPAPLLYASPAQINLQIPFEVAGSAEVVISHPGGRSAAIPVPVSPVQPGIFFVPATGAGAIVHNSDGRLTTERPARAGDYLQVYATGLGVVSPAVPAGLAAPLTPLSHTVEQPRVTIAGREAAVAFSGLAPGFAGLYQLTVRVPENAPAGRQPFSLTIGGRQSNEVFLTLQ
jgi:uncharacterized protein (TIGR03437 family)